jgi:hypothetical protein
VSYDHIVDNLQLSNKRDKIYKKLIAIDNLTKDDPQYDKNSIYTFTNENVINHSSLNPLIPINPNTPYMHPDIINAIKIVISNNPNLVITFTKKELEISL